MTVEEAVKEFIKPLKTDKDFSDDPNIYMPSCAEKREFAIAELEQIKAEIAESFSSSVSDCIYIIDKHISKLKGDINGK